MNFFCFSIRSSSLFSLFNHTEKKNTKKKNNSQISVILLLTPLSTMSINIVLEEIKGTPTSIIPILSLLHNDKQILSNISKPNLNHLISRTLNLVRSPQPYNKWCGINLIRVIVEDYTILASEGNNLLTNLVKVLENYNNTIDIKILTSTIDTINFMCDSIRGKPTLTREILTPKLSSIISYYFEYLHFSPCLILKSLQKILKFHPTTFRPFGNKLNNKLIGLMNTFEFINFPNDLKQAIYDTIAMLPVIEKNEPESKWNNDVISIIGEIGELIQIYQEFLNFKDDQTLIDLSKKLPKSNSKLLSDLSIDFNKPGSILKISNNLNILVGLLKSYMSAETPFTVKIPLGLILITCEVVASINVKFLAFKSDVRDEEIKKLIKLSLVENYRSIIGLLSQLTIFHGSLIPHISTIWSFLETLIPYKNKRIVNDDILDCEILYVDVLNCMVDYLSLIGYVSDNTQLLRFVDLALVLIEPRIKKQDTTTTNNKNTIQQHQHNKKQKKKKNTSSVPLSDILSHEHLFTETIPSSTVKSVRSFISQIITKCTLPPTQHYKIMRYLIIESVYAKYYNLQHSTPKELQDLLINAVLYPGYEKISILPIVTSILGGQSKVLSVFNNPRFPPLPKYINSVDQVLDDEVEEEDDEEEEAEEEQEVKEKVEPKRQAEDNEFVEENPTKKRKVDEDLMIERSTDEQQVEIPVEDKPKLFSKENMQAQEQVVEEVVAVEEKVEIVENIKIATVQPEVPVQVEESQDEGSDFEMPEINIDDDSDDE